MALTEEQIDQLVRGFETSIHQHPRHIMDADDVYNLQTARAAFSVTGDYMLKPNDEIVLVDTSGGSVTITLPHSSFQKEYQVVKVAGANPVYVVPTSGETIFGSSDGITFNNIGTSVNLKSIANVGYWLI